MWVALQLITRYRAIFAPLAAILISALFIWGAVKWVRADERRACNVDWNNAAADARAAAQEKIGGIKHDYDKIIGALPHDGAGDAPAVDAAIDSLHARRGGK